MLTTSTRRRVAAATLATTVTAGLLAGTGPSAEAGTTAPATATAIHIAQPTGDRTPQPVDPYPSRVTTWGIDGPITDVNVDLNRVALGYPSDVDFLLVSPEGTAVVLASAVCGSQPVTDQYWTFDDEASTSMPRTGCTSGRYRPTPSYQENFPPPAPARGTAFPWYGRQLSAFRGENPNGDWRLYVHDRNPLHTGPNGQPTHLLTDRGVVSGGFRIIIATQTRSVVIPGGTTGAGPASTYPVIERVSGLPGVVEDTSVVLENLSHSYPDDLDVLLVSPTGQKVLLMSDACGNGRIPNGTSLRISDGDPAFPDEGSCRSADAGVTFSPTDHQPGESLPAPAPPGPYTTSLSVLRGIDPNGLWKLYVADDGLNESGYLEDFGLVFDPTAPPPEQDTIAPNTRVVAHPQARTSSRKARFAFTASEASASFQCRIDGRPWTTCTSPRTYRGIEPGRHRFRTRAMDAAGNTDQSPATWTWRVRR